MKFYPGCIEKNPKLFCFFLACITEMLYICIVNQPSINIKIPTHELERNEKNGIVYHREGIWGDYDDFDDVEALIQFIKTGERS